MHSTESNTVEQMILHAVARPGWRGAVRRALGFDRLWETLQGELRPTRWD